MHFIENTQQKARQTISHVQTLIKITARTRDTRFGPILILYWFSKSFNLYTLYQKGSRFDKNLNIFLSH